MRYDAKLARVSMAERAHLSCFDAIDYNVSDCFWLCLQAKMYTGLMESARGAGAKLDNVVNTLALRRAIEQYELR